MFLCYYETIQAREGPTIDTRNGDTSSLAAAFEAPHLPRWNELPAIELYMDQVLILVEEYLSPFIKKDEKILTAAMINNYVKTKILPPPIKKRYDRQHLAYLIFICMIKPVFPISEIHELLIKGHSKEDLPAFYDRFCQAQERTYAFLVEAAQQGMLSFIDDDASLAHKPALNLALLTAAGKNTTEKLLRPN